MDESFLEQATELTESIIADGLTKARIKPVRPADFDGFCTCGEEIPAARIELGHYDCTTCRSRKEARGRYFSR